MIIAVLSGSEVIISCSYSVARKAYLISAKTCNDHKLQNSFQSAVQTHEFHVLTSYCLVSQGFAASADEILFFLIARDKHF